MNLVVDLLDRVFFPLVGLPQGVTGWRPPEVRPSRRHADDRRDSSSRHDYEVCGQASGCVRPCQGNIHVIGVGYRADGCETLAVDQPLLPGIQADDDIALVAADDLRIGAGRTRHRGTLADLHLDIWTIVPTGILASAIALPGFTSVCALEITSSPAAKRCGAMM